MAKKAKAAEPANAAADPAATPDSVTIAIPNGELPAELVEHGALVVRAKRGTRRRAGLAFGPEERAIPIRLLSAIEFAAIVGDPVLITDIRVQRPD